MMPRTTLTFLLEKYNCIETGLCSVYVADRSILHKVPRVWKHLPSLSEIVQGEGGIELTSVRKKEAERWVSKSSLLLRIMTRVPRIKPQAKLMRIFYLYIKANK